MWTFWKLDYEGGSCPWERLAGAVSAIWLRDPDCVPSGRFWMTIEDVDVYMIFDDIVHLGDSLAYVLALTIVFNKTCNFKFHFKQKKTRF